MSKVHEALQNKVAVVTGGSGVLCSEMAMELARQGMRVAILNRTAQKGEAVVRSITENGGEAINFSVDVLNKESLIAARQAILQQYGQIDVLINGAGGNHPDAITADEVYKEQSATPNFFELTPNGFESVFSNNFTGTFLAAQVFGEALLRTKGTIINISSMSSYAPMTKVPAYSAAKAAINNFTQWMAVHFAEAGLRVNAIAPGFFITEQNRNLLLTEDGSLTARSEKIITATPQKRFGKPQDLLGTLLFLADDTYSAFVTGVTIPVDGGFMAYSGV
ncbi:SDR family oxidoreductase [Lysinibacillus sp. OL1_EC]|uniref:SDR family oxidoreductase n=1 Tax=unclassified Lysinibacillus TaxID=2636778 RepID=UPI001039BF95|nr:MULTISPECIES: SDR family oxidoreductase [unclassified Lysinibacillus]MCM0624800.1 SDR family oxidoreductase [Lysinibacillus sp. OL1_EC]MCS5502686.1 SDR family oxidoreductase [Lysinibacillus sp. A4]TBV87787.1 SDR family NAD(P)-dependent oxidoreductase [Lysinibacillus sp. OL1]UKJ45274.1 SDR family oxidoreductase [Lysinibacillus sp. ACHW1.5]WGT40393.1 SDR family oxidoreductase [Lysinibacillus sp. 1 U-2021]